jgi:hypothetical protein
MWNRASLYASQRAVQIEKSFFYLGAISLPRWRIATRGVQLKKQQEGFSVTNKFLRQNRALLQAIAYNSVK